MTAKILFYAYWTAILGSFAFAVIMLIIMVASGHPLGDPISEYWKR